MQQDLIPLFDDHSHPQINRLLNEQALRCPECGAHQTSLLFFSDSSIVKPRYLIACSECKCRGRFGRNLHHAVKLWNKPPGFFATLLHNWKKKRAKRQLAISPLKKVMG